MSPVSREPLVCDTSGVLAALDTADPDHEACRAVLEAHAGPLVVSSLVLAEVDHLVRTRLGPEPARAFVDDVVAGAYDLATLTDAQLALGVEVDRQYADLGLGLTDAHLVVLAAERGTTTLLTLDERHFRAVRPLEGTSFRLLPADGSA